jgi:hypothetical protein
MVEVTDGEDRREHETQMNTATRPPPVLSWVCPAYLLARLLPGGAALGA